MDHCNLPTDLDKWFWIEQCLSLETYVLAKNVHYKHSHTCKLLTSLEYRCTMRDFLWCMSLVPHRLKSNDKSLCWTYNNYQESPYFFSKNLPRFLWFLIYGQNTCESYLQFHKYDAGIHKITTQRTQIQWEVNPCFPGALVVNILHQFP